MKNLLLAIGAVLIIAIGIGIWLFKFHTAEPAAVETVSSVDTTTAAPTPTPDVTATTNAPTTDAASETNTVTAPTTNAAPAVDTTATPATTNAAPTPDTTAAANASTNQTVFYQDNFGRKGDLDASSPDTKNSGTAKWTVSSGSGNYATTGSVAFDNTTAYDAAFLPVNGTSGVTLDGKQNFTVAATVVPDSLGSLGIGLNTAPIESGHNIFDNGLAEITVGNGNATAYSAQTNLKYDPFGDAVKAPYTISMTYHATSGTITFAVGDSVIATQPGITADKIAALNAVSIGNGASGPTAVLTSFKLSVGGSD